MSPTARRDRLVDLDRRLVAIAKRVRVLGELSWPSEVIEAFLEGHRRGAPRLPDAPLPRAARGEELEALEALRRELDQDADPVHRFLDDTIGSYVVAARMLSSAGSPEFHALSRTLYGAPTDRLPGAKHSHLEAADELLSATARLADAGIDPEPDFVIPASLAAVHLRERLGRFFTHHEVTVEVDAHLASKAAAGARRVRLRGHTGFSEQDLEQLLEHEAFVHTATSLNGREQPVLTSLGLSAPRTTMTQEGIATVAELATRTIDIARLRRVALRVRAIHLAMDGADFIDVFRFFLAEGQSEDESVRSAMRVFRGGDVRGRWVFTKDVVYLQGLVAVHTFLRKAIASHRPHLVERLFAGRIALSDVLLLEPAFADGTIAPPLYVPAWARNLRSLAAYLAFTAVANRIDVGGIELEEILPAVDL